MWCVIFRQTFLLRSSKKLVCQLVFSLRLADMRSHKNVKFKLPARIVCSLIHSSTQPLTSLIHSLVRSFVLPSVCPSIHPSIHSFIHSLIHPSIHQKTAQPNFTITWTSGHLRDGDVMTVVRGVKCSLLESRVGPRDVLSHFLLVDRRWATFPHLIN